MLQKSSMAVKHAGQTSKTNGAEQLGEAGGQEPRYLFQVPKCTLLTPLGGHVIPMVPMMVCMGWEDRRTMYPPPGSGKAGGDQTVGTGGQDTKQAKLNAKQYLTCVLNTKWIL